MSLDDQSFIKYIESDKQLTRKYNRELKAQTRIIKRTFRVQKKEQKEKFPSDLSDRETHDELVKMSVHPFSENKEFVDKLEYKLVMCDPLNELKVPNFDFLIAKYSPNLIILIFGDAKTATAGANRIIHDLKSKKESVEKNLDYIKQNYLKNSSTQIKIEYVVTVNANFASDMRDAIEVDGGGFIVWQVDRHASTIGLVNPGHNNKHQRTMLHAENKLNSKFKDVLTPHNTLYSFFPSSHPITKLKAIFQLIEYNKAIAGSAEIMSSQMDDFLKIQLHYLPDQLKNNERVSILQTGMEIGFLENIDSKFKVKNEYSSGMSREIVVEKLWINNQIKIKQEKELIEMKIKLQKEIKEEFDNKPRLDNYFSNSINNDHH